MALRIVLDTNVLISGIRSRQGASFRVLELVGSGRFTVCISVPLILEYQAASQRILPSTRLGKQDIDELIDFFCSVGERHQIHYLWRPQLQDPKDDMILELAMAAQANAIVTFNMNHFKEVLHFGIEVISPQDLLSRIGAGK
jgi:putative PIN family toxin of toxin-antitoxin system